MVHYVNGQRQEIPLATGRDLGDWWEEARDEGKPLVLTWTGANESSRKFKRGIRLY